jgi:anti-sigma factor RsiW
MNGSMRHAPEEALEDYAMGRLSAYRARRLEEHLASCRDCRERLAVEIEIVRTLRAAGSRLGVRKKRAQRCR